MAEPTNDPDHKEDTAWGTLEELLLACAVNRHGTNCWDSVSRELQKRTSTFSLLTPHICKQKYRDLKRRFAAVSCRNSDGFSGDDNSTATSLWLDELRKLRVAELKRELERYDLSIVSLQLKVKRLKEEREQSLEEEKEEREGSDLQENQERERFPAAKNEVDEPATEPVEPESGKLDRVNEPADEEDYSCSDSKDLDSGKARVDQYVERVDSVELVESVSESKGGGGGGGGGGEEGLKESSDVLSTASLSKEKNRRERKVVVKVVSGNSSGEENQSAATKSTTNGKSHPLVDFLNVIRARKFGSVFERPLESQGTSEYRNLIRLHIDLETIQRRLEEGEYTDKHIKFYRDFMLLINNAIVFFTYKSSEHKAALELRQLVTKQLHSHLYLHKSQPPKPSLPAPLPKPPKSEPNPADQTTYLKPKLAITGPVIACRKRSSVVGKASVLEKPAIVEKTSSSSSSLNAMSKKRTRDQSFGSRNSNSNPSPSPSLSPVDKKKPSSCKNSNKIKRGSGSGNGLLLDLLKNSVDRKSEMGKDKGSRNSTGSKVGKEKGKQKVEEREGVVSSRSIKRPPKRAAAVAAMEKRSGGGGGGEGETLPKKRQRK